MCINFHNSGASIPVRSNLRTVFPLWKIRDYFTKRRKNRDKSTFEIAYMVSFQNSISFPGLLGRGSIVFTGDMTEYNFWILMGQHKRPEESPPALLKLAQADLMHKEHHGGSSGQRELYPAPPPRWLMCHGKRRIACI